MSEDATLFKRLMNSKFDGCQLLATTEAPALNRTMKVYRIGNRRDVIGIHDGIDSWIASPGSCLRDLKIPQLLESQTPVIARRAVVTTSTKPTVRRKLINV